MATHHHRRHPLGKPAELNDDALSAIHRTVTPTPASYAEILRSACGDDLARDASRLATSLEAARARRAHILLCGNGGSAANANHWAIDLLYGAGRNGRGGLRAHSLSANTAVTTCLANDTGYENIFAGQLRVLASPGDVLLALSGSGNSPNILRALDEAAALGMESWAIVGFDGGAALAKAQHHIHFPVHNMQAAEDLQTILCHMVTAILAAPPPAP